eukprot:scaffold56166_cov64-Phaeocystis_antarctica.AAC.9
MAEAPKPTAVWALSVCNEGTEPSAPSLHPLHTAASCPLPLWKGGASARGRHARLLCQAEERSSLPRNVASLLEIEARCAASAWISSAPPEITLRAANAEAGGGSLSSSTSSAWRPRPGSFASSGECSRAPHTDASGTRTRRTRDAKKSPAWPRMWKPTRPESSSSLIGSTGRSSDESASSALPSSSSES